MTFGTVFLKVILIMYIISYKYGYISFDTLYKHYRNLNKGILKQIAILTEKLDLGT